MSKPKTQPVAQPDANPSRRSADDDGGQQEPLSGSKKVKNRQHTRHNNGEG